VSDDVQDLIGDFADKLRESADPEVAAAKGDICAFAEYVLRDPYGNKVDLQSFHREMLYAAASERFLAIEAFRGSGKSTLMSVCYPLYRIMKNRDTRIMLVTASDSLSKEWLRHIENYMRAPQYQKLVGDIVPEPRDNLVWTNEVKVVRGRSTAAGGATLLALGIGGQIRGRRTDVVICDDLVSESNSHTQYQRDVLEHWFHSAVIPTLDHNPADPISGQCIVVGTPLYDADLMATLKDEWNDEALADLREEVI